MRRHFFWVPLFEGGGQPEKVTHHDYQWPPIFISNSFYIIKIRLFAKKRTKKYWLNGKHFGKAQFFLEYFNFQKKSIFFCMRALNVSINNSCIAILGYKYFFLETLGGEHRKSEIRKSENPKNVRHVLPKLFSLGRGQNQSFGPKQNTKFGVGSTI